MVFPKHILKALSSNKTSLGEHPSYPPEEEEKFIIRLVKEYFDEITENVDDVDINELKVKLGKLIVSCKRIETQYKDNLEQLCGRIVTELFDIPENTVDLSMSIVDKVDSDNQRLVPEQTEDFSFESISDLNKLTGEIYKRRMLNALVAGASLYYTDSFTNYLKELFDINSELPSLYKRLMDLNRILLYVEKDSLNNDETNIDGGKVDVLISSSENLVQIKSEGIIFPILLEETIKGLLELAISHGLPNDRDKANYVIGKSDFKLAEVWDCRLGLPLWKRLHELCEDKIEDVGINFFLMTLSQLPTDEFNQTLQESFAKTKEGKRMVDNIISEIEHQKDRDNFDDYIDQNNQQFQINDDEFFDPNELLNED